MEIRVWHEGVLRDVCGVNEKNTCHDVILLLAQTASITGSFSLFLLVDDSEIPLSPQDRPGDILKKYSSEKNIQFILRRSNDNENMYKKLKNHLAYQEQEIENNRLKLSEMDQEIMELQKSQLTNLNEEELVAMIAEQKEQIDQLEKMQWVDIVAEYRQKCRAISLEKSSLDARIKELEAAIQDARATHAELRKQCSRKTESGQNRAPYGVWF